MLVQKQEMLFILMTQQVARMMHAQVPQAIHLQVRLP